ncbi:MAG: adenosylmethionine-8-amino-7-oxononanoate aminotransferase [Alphaproteobacteria bacterium]|jgi:adenosylmethionine-8-amino-7-oxononanoate aminotransferase
MTPGPKGQRRAASLPAPHTRVLHRHAHADLPIAVGGDGPYVIDSHGKRYLDASGGAAVSCLGYSDAEITAAIQKQAGRLAYVHSSFFTTEPMEQLGDLIVAGAPAGLDRVYLVSGGSEAIETALKMARQYFVEIGQPARRHFIARRQSYHGNTLGALAVGGNELRRAPFRSMMAESHHVSPCYAYRERRGGESDDQYTARLADELEAKILELGPETAAAFVAETVVGATSGAVPPVAGYFQLVREICDKYGVLLVLDEVMCGTGRTGTLFAFEQEGIVPDLVAVAKGLAAGYQPIGAVLLREDIFRAFYDGSGFFQHGHTFMGHATSCAAAIVVQQKLQDPAMMANVRRLGAYFADGLQTAFGGHPHVGDIRGRGMFRGIELVADRTTKAPFDPSLRLHARIKAAAMDNGLMCYPAGGTIDGRVGDHILLAPPYIVSESQIDEIVARLGVAIDAAIAGSQK